MKDEWTDEHESYAMVGLYRQTNNGGKYPLFGSNLERHPSTMALRIVRANRQHAHGRDWYFGREPICEVTLSAAQFAELITNPNVGSGVPCTLRYADGREVEACPEQVPEAQKIREQFELETGELREKALKGRERVEQALEGVKAKKTRDAVLGAYDAAVRFLFDSGPFLTRQFHEASDRAAVAAKQEIDAFAQGLIHKLGVRALQAGDTDEPLLLTDEIED